MIIFMAFELLKTTFCPSKTEFRHVSGFCPKSMHPVILFILSLKLKLFENHRKTISYKKYDLKPLSEYSKFQRN